MDYLNKSNFIIDVNDFTTDSFSIKYFLSKNRNFNLEIVANDLEVLLKVLKMSMAKLSDFEYENFLHLSFDLKNIHKILNVIRITMLSITREIGHIKTILFKKITLSRKLMSEKKALNELRKIISNQIIKRKLKLHTNDEVNKYIFKINNNYKKNEDDNGSNEIPFNVNNENTLNLFKNNQISILNKIVMTSYVLNWNSYLENSYKTYLEKFINLELKKLTKKQALSTFIMDLYNNLLTFASKNLISLQQICSRNQDIDFLINSFWVEVAKQFQLKLPLIFSAGDTEQFILRLEITQEFLKNFEKLLKRKKYIKKFRKNSKTKKFIESWNFEIYFQIKFFEILNELEKNCNKLTADNYVTIYNQAHQTIILLWSPKIYNYKMYSSFIKVSLQIISRVKVAVDLLLKTKSEKVATKVFINSFKDILMLSENIFEYQKLVIKNAPKNVDVNIVIVCFDKSNKSLNKTLFDIEFHITNCLITESVSYLKSVTDLSRLFRKTNREVPTLKSNYVLQMTEVYKTFKENYNGIFKPDIMERILRKGFSSTTSKYLTAIQEVLVSIKRTEESLKRLKSVRTKATKFPSSEQNFVGDDDKIKIQLQIDILYWLEKQNEIAGNVCNSETEKLHKILNELKL